MKSNGAPIYVENLFTDEQMKQFIERGYVVIKPDIPRSLHESIYENVDNVVTVDGNPGNNLLARVPEIQEVINHPSVIGALRSVLGPDYMMHPHRHPHVNLPGSIDGDWHQDTYWGFVKPRSHRCWWAMVFYYPQNTSLDNGPTAVIPGSQYKDSMIKELKTKGNPIMGEAGTIAILHYDLWHKSMANSSQFNRYMLKFQFMRKKRPSNPSWNSKDIKCYGPMKTRVLNENELVCKHVWQWASGGVQGENISNPLNNNINLCLETIKNGVLDDKIQSINYVAALGDLGFRSIPTLIDLMNKKYSPANLSAAYALSAMGKAAIEPLISLLWTKNESARRLGSLGLIGIGPAATRDVMKLLESKVPDIRALGCWILGEINAGDSSGLLSLLADDQSVEVRRNAVEALGIIQTDNKNVIASLMKALENDSDAQTRFTAALSLARMPEKAGEAIPALMKGLKDENRYVRGYCVQALRNIKTLESTNVLIEHLSTMRWCNSTNPKSTF